MKHRDLFEFKEWASFGGPVSNSMLRATALEISNMDDMIYIEVNGQNAISLPIPRTEESSPELSLYWNKAQSKIQVGEVIYDSPNVPLTPWKFQLQRPKNKFNCRINFADGGGLVTTDIRDIGKITINYHFDLVPISFTIEGNHLVIRSLTYDPSSSLDSWYEESYGS